MAEKQPLRAKGRQIKEDIPLELHGCLEVVPNEEEKKGRYYVSVFSVWGFSGKSDSIKTIYDSSRTPHRKSNNLEWD